MEFTRLAEVEVVETANDTDKVLIEQNGEIKRVPKTEVGGSGGGMLVVNADMDMETEEVTASANMTLEEVLAALTNRELTGATVYMAMSAGGQVTITMLDVAACADYSTQAGFPAVMVMSAANQIPLLWTADGFSMMN